MNNINLSHQQISSSHFSGCIKQISSAYAIRDFLNVSLGFDLSDVKIETPDQQESLKKNIYSLIHSSEFNALYLELVSEVSVFFPYPILCQKSPTLRIQRPNENSIIFHIDEWAGHDCDSLNVWLPLVDIDSSSSLGVVNPSETSTLLSDFYNSKISSDLLESFCREKASFSSMKVGEALFFGNHTLHGTQKNLSNSTRISIDFRVTAEATTKNLHQRYISPNNLNELPNACSSSTRNIVYCIRSSNNLLDVSFQEQRRLISSYCQRNGFLIVAETHEIQGRAVPELPFITRLLDKHPHCDLVMLSKGCFYSEELKRLGIIQSQLASSGQKLIFIIS